MAWLKNISKNPLALKEDDSERELAQTVLNELCENDRIYSFYKKFKGVLDIPYNMQGLTIIEYISAPADKVTISYTINGGDRLTQVMKSNEWGIFTCRFHLFYGDVLEYTFSVNDEDSRQCMNSKMYLERIRKDAQTCSMSALQADSSTSLLPLRNRCTAIVSRNTLQEKCLQLRNEDNRYG